MSVKIILGSNDFENIYISITNANISDRTSLRWFYT